MSAVINELFDQIVASERKAQESKSLLNEVKANIAACTEKIKHTQSEYKTQHREYNHSVLAWNELEVSLKYEKVQEECCKQQKAKCEQQKAELEKKLIELSGELEKCQTDFCQSVDDFCGSYDLVATEQQQRLNRAKMELYNLQQYDMSLTRDLLAYGQKRSTVTRLTNEKTGLMHDIEWKKRCLREAEKKLAEEEAVVEQLLAKKETVDAVPQTNADFIKLHAELDEYRCDDIEKQCTELEQQLQELQKQPWLQSHKPHRLLVTQGSFQPQGLKPHGQQPQALQPQVLQLPGQDLLTKNLEHKQQKNQSQLQTRGKFEAKGDQLPVCQKMSSQHHVVMASSAAQLPVSASQATGNAGTQPQGKWKFQKAKNQPGVSYSQPDPQSTNVHRITNFNIDPISTRKQPGNDWK